MFNAVRRGPALARAFRACAPRALPSARTTSALVANFKTALPSTYSPVSQVRLFQSTISAKQQVNAAVQDQEAPKGITQFNELAVQGLVHPRIIHSITERMGIQSMTDVQRLTIQNTIQGIDT
jgi:ATP-dependent RNA helicase MSS116, mitochondrial